jgi:4-amino-4-deoxy-L-arabinose transferase-like glycosyltransferase
MVFLIGTIPWTVPALRVLAGGWRRRIPGEAFQGELFLWIWMVFVCLFFSLSDSKLMPYILPAMPALAVLIAVRPIGTLQRDFLITAILTVLAGVVLGVASFYAPRLVPASAAQPYFLSLAKPLREVAALLIVSGAFVWVQGARDATRAGIFLGAGWSLAGLVLIRSAALLAPIYSGEDLARSLPTESRDAPLYSVHTYDQTLPFYLRRTVTLVGYRGELDYGLRRSPGGEIADTVEFLKVWEAQTRAFAVMDKRTFNDFKERGVPMRKVGENVAHVMVARQ